MAPSMMARETVSSPSENIVGKYPGPMSELVPSGYAREPIKNIIEITKNTRPEYRSFLDFTIIELFNLHSYPPDK
jgi:hypothetical protein